MKPMRACVLNAVLPILCLILTGTASRAYAAENWTRLESANFSVAGDADPLEMERVARRLERFRAVFVSRFPGYRFTSPVPTKVIVFRDARTFSRFAKVEWAAGYYLAGDDVNFIVLPAEGGTKLSTIFHEYTHHLVESTLGRANVPPWLNEGIAEYHETFLPANDDSAVLGAPNEAHLALLRKSEWIPFDSVFSTDYYSLHRQTRENALRFYAQSWLLVHFLIHGGDSIRKSEFDRFVGMITTGRRFDDALRQSFGIDPAALDAALRAYVRRKKFASETISKPDSIAATPVRPMPVSDADALAVKSEIMLRSDRLADAEVLVNDALTADRNSVHANVVAGLLRIRQKNWREARRHLELATGSESAGYFAHFWLGFAVVQENMTDLGFVTSIAPGDADLIRRALGRAIELNPQFAESYSLLAFVSFVRNERVDEGIAEIRKALAIAPGNQWFAIRHAELLMRKEDFAAARQIVSGIRQTASTDQLKLYAENTLRNINSLEAQMRSIEESEKRERSEVTDAPLSEEEIARRRDAAMLESLNLTLRRPRGDEKRLVGRLKAIECRPDEMLFQIETGAGKLRFHSATLDTVQLISFDQQFVNAEFGCGPVVKENLAVFTYRPADAKGTTGRLIAIEFVPKTFRLLDPSQ